MLTRLQSATSEILPVSICQWNGDIGWHRKTSKIGFRSTDLQIDKFRSISSNIEKRATEMYENAIEELVEKFVFKKEWFLIYEKYFYVYCKIGNFYLLPFQ